MADITLSHRLFDQAVGEPEYVTTPESDAPQEDDDWEQLKSEAATIMETDNSNFWRKGELALRCTRRYGEGSLSKFGQETGLGAGKTLYEHAQLAEFFVPSARVQVPTLLKEHFKQAFRTINKSPKPIQNKLGATMGFLKQANDNGWTAAKMGREMALALGQKARESWVFEPQDVVFVGGYTTLLMSEDEQKRVQKALVHKGKPSFKVTLRFSVEHEPEV